MSETLLLLPWLYLLVILVLVSWCSTGKENVYFILARNRIQLWWFDEPIKFNWITNQFGASHQQLISDTTMGMEFWTNIEKLKFILQWGKDGKKKVWKYERQFRTLLSFLQNFFSHLLFLSKLLLVFHLLMYNGN